jgi:prepilin-type N-terminal cleavage/methylation domain-containing protein
VNHRFVSPIKHHFSLGFTLIEILISLAITGIALTAVLKSGLLIQEALIETQRNQLKSRLASEKLSELQIQGLSSLVQWHGVFENHPEYEWEVKTSPLFNTPLNHLTLSIYPSDAPQDLFVLEQLFFVANE